MEDAALLDNFISPSDTKSPELETIAHLHTIDGWEFIQSEEFPDALKIVKTRKNNTPISLHYLPQTNRFVKLSEDPSWNTLIDKEHAGWKIAAKVFGFEDETKEGVLQKDNKNLRYIEMPNAGIPIKYFEKITPGTIPDYAFKDLIENLRSMVGVHRLYISDLNPGNILVRIEDGKYRLVIIDWESTHIVNEHKISDETRHQLRKCYNTLSQYYPNIEVPPEIQ